MATLRVIFDCDPGNGVPGADVDDGLALLLARRSPEMRLEAVTTVAGNVPLEAATTIALDMLEADGASTPVFVGSEAPLVQDPRWWRTELDGRGSRSPATEIWEGAYRFPEAKGRPQAVRAARAIVDMVSANPGQIALVATGPLTNVALAMRLDPGLATALGMLVVMGGAFTGPGGLRELNFAYDPEAAHIVLTSGAPITLVPLDITRQTMFTLRDNERLQHSKDRMSRLTARTIEPWLRWLMAIRGSSGCHLHDPLAMAVAIDSSLVETAEMQLTVELHGEFTRGRPVAWLADGREFTADVGRQGRSVNVAQGLDNERFMRMLMDRLT